MMKDRDSIKQVVAKQRMARSERSFRVYQVLKLIWCEIEFHRNLRQGRARQSQLAGNRRSNQAPGMDSYDEEFKHNVGENGNDGDLSSN